MGEKPDLDDRDLTVDDFNASDFMEQMEHFQSESLIQQALGGQGDGSVGIASKSIEGELREVERESLREYVRESQNLSHLKADIEGCSLILGSMEDVLSSFESNLGSLGDKIRTLQTKGSSLRQKLANRQEVERNLLQFTESISFSQRLLREVDTTPIGDAFASLLMKLSARLSNLDTPMAKASKAAMDVREVAESVRKKASDKVVAFLVDEMQTLCQSKTSFQVMQQRLMSHSIYTQFLREHSKEGLESVFSTYEEIMSRTLYNFLRKYIKSMLKVMNEPPTKVEYVGGGGAESGPKFSLSTIKQAFTKSGGGTGSLSVGVRLKELERLEDPPLHFNQVQNTSTRLSAETIYRTLHRYLIDMATSEYYFICKFFDQDRATTEFFPRVFSVAVDLLYDQVESALKSTVDVFFAVVMAGMFKGYKEMLRKRKIYTLNKYFDKAEQAAWVRANELLKSHIGSIPQWGSEEKESAAAKSDRLHPLTARVAPFLSSLVALRARVEDKQEVVSTATISIRNEYLRIVKKWAKTGKKLGPFSEKCKMMLNYDCILQSILAQEATEEALQDDNCYMYFKEMTAAETTNLANSYLALHFPALVGLENAIRNEKDEDVIGMERDVRTFGQEWAGIAKDLQSELKKTLSVQNVPKKVMKEVVVLLAAKIEKCTAALRKNAKLASIASYMPTPAALRSGLKGIDV